MNTDVLVIGAGPVGMTMAAELRRYGLSVRIIDLDTARTDKSKALVIWPRTLELIARMGDGAAEKFIAAGRKASGARIHTGSRQIGEIGLQHIDSPYNFVLMIPQSETERVLEEHLAALGLKVERQTELTNFSEGSQSVTSTLKHADGREETVETKWLIGCDGAHSTVRHKLGMEFHGSTLLTDFLLADVHLRGMPDATAMDMYWNAEGILAVFPMEETRYRIIADIGESAGMIGEGHRPPPTLEDVQAILDHRGPHGITAYDPVWMSAFSINERKVEDYRAGRVFLAGDAAHVHSPAGGQGMNTGMQDAYNLAWKLALVTRGLCNAEPLLSSYSTERSAIARLVLEATGKATQMALLKGNLMQAMRNHLAALLFGFAPFKDVMANVISEEAVSYPESELNAKVHASADPKPGKRAPIRTGESAIGAGNTPRFALCASGDGTPATLLAKYAAILEPELRAPFAAEALSLVRPDGYVALSAKSGNWASVENYLKGLSPN